MSKPIKQSVKNAYIYSIEIISVIKFYRANVDC